MSVQIDALAMQFGQITLDHAELRYPFRIRTGTSKSPGSSRAYQIVPCRAPSSFSGSELPGG